MKTNSIRFKASILYTGILCLILVAFSTFLFHTVSQILYRDVEEELELKVEQIDSFIDAYAAISQSDRSPASLMHQLFATGGEIVTDKKVVDQLWAKDSQSLGLQNDLFRILNPKGLVIMHSANLTTEAARNFNAQFSPLSNKLRFTSLQINGAVFYGINHPITFADRSALILQLATPMSSIQRILSRLLFSIITGIGAILLITIFMGTFLTQRILRPVTDVTAIADSISHKNLHLRISVQTLDQEMELLVKSFNQMIERLEKSFAHINEFSSHVAHEMKTPLAIIKGELELALGSKSTKEENSRIMTAMLEEVDRLIKTIKDLLLLAKYEYQSDIFKMDRMDMTTFLKEACEHSKILAAEKNIRLELSTPNEPLWLQGDAVHLRRIFFNLVHNAVKFTPTGGEINISTDVRDGQAFVSVKDTGIGVAPADQPRIFEKFYRVRRSDQEDAGGTGLGLSMARSIARAHDGDITFESDLGKGSVFTVRLPIQSDRT